MSLIQDLYEDIEPIEVDASFVNGPFDGKVTKITVKKKLDKSVMIIMRDKSIYRFREPYVFEFDGYQPAPEPDPKLTLKQKLVRWLLS